MFNRIMLSGANLVFFSFCYVSLCLVSCDLGMDSELCQANGTLIDVVISGLVASLIATLVRATLLDALEMRLKLIANLLYKKKKKWPAGQRSTSFKSGKLGPRANS